MTCRVLSRCLPLVALIALTSPALAHVGGHSAAGVAAGLAHPFSGLDHMLAMVAIGLWASQLGRPAIWLIPLLFPAVMAFGAMLGIAGVPLAGVELGIAASVLVLGAAVAFAAKPSLAIAAVLTAVFAVFHGHSHGTELPAAGSAVTYGIGFVAATLALHGAGLALGLLTQHNTGRFVARTAGAGVAVAGALLLITA